MSQTDPNIEIVIVTYRSSDLIATCLSRLPKDLLVHLVDNASEDFQWADLPQLTGPTHVVQLEENIGYGRANNIALKEMRSKYALLLNPDALVDGELIDALLRIAQANPEYALIAPTLTREIKPDRVPAWSGDPNLREVASVIGAVALLDLKAGREIGFFDEAFFLYGEDIDLCNRLRQAGWRVGIVDGLFATHLGNASSKPSFGLQWQKNVLAGRSIAYLRQKECGTRGKAFLIRRGLVHLVRALTSALRFRTNRAHFHLGRAVGYLFYLLTDRTGPKRAIRILKESRCHATSIPKIRRGQ